MSFQLSWPVAKFTSKQKEKAERLEFLTVGHYASTTTVVEVMLTDASRRTVISVVLILANKQSINAAYWAMFSLLVVDNYVCKGVVLPESATNLFLGGLMYKLNFTSPLIDAHGSFSEWRPLSRGL